MVKEPRMRSTKRIWRLILTVGLICLVIVGSALFRREPGLLERATKVADVKAWWGPEPVVYEYRWISDTVVFTGSGDWRLKDPFLYDIRSRQNTPLFGLRKLLEKDNDMGTQSWELSPDKKWLLWNMELFDDVHAARLDGSGFETVSLPSPANTVGQIAWEDDSRHWRAVGFVYDSRETTNIIGGDVEAPGQRRTLPLSPEDNFFESRAPIVGPEGKYAKVEPTQKTSVLPHSAWKVLYAPRDTKIIAVEQSHQGDRLAWVLLSTHEAPLMHWLRRLFPQKVSPVQASAEIWISRSDGREMHEVGRLLLSDEDEKIDPLHGLQWLPSARRLSFLNKDSLWTVPAD
ncbi:MAG: hypothetical protein JWN14_310 [Chthonomonadales bacterium]|nr:hypothetical protein [Chthonomonadales bacterium]